MKTDQCFFCKLRDDDKNGQLFYNESFISHLSDGPINPGHIELFTIRHISSILELNEIEQKQLIPSLNQTIELLKAFDFLKFYTNVYKTTQKDLAKTYSEKMLKLKFISNNPTGFNYGINQGISAGQTVMHLHIHIIPRFDGDTTDPTGGVRNFLNDLGNYKKYIKV
ncbi:HIT family protein [Candidatus Dojkabacteria bacterium]|nr:HIT family protein [Candidatus Dojkabacteria bacterium]